jgi:hypothetical protein
LLGILDDYYTLVSENKLLNQKGLRQILNYRINYMFWLSVLNYNSSPQEARCIACYKWYLDSEQYNLKVLKKIRSLTQNNKWEDSLNYFLTLTKNEKDKQELKEIIYERFKDNRFK